MCFKERQVFQTTQRVLFVEEEEFVCELTKWSTLFKSLKIIRNSDCKVFLQNV